MKYVLMLLVAHAGWFSSSVDVHFEDMTSRETCQRMADTLNAADDKLPRRTIHATCFEK